MFVFLCFVVFVFVILIMYFCVRLGMQNAI